MNCHALNKILFLIYSELFDSLLSSRNELETILDDTDDSLSDNDDASEQLLMNELQQVTQFLTLC